MDDIRPEGRSGIAASSLHAIVSQPDALGALSRHVDVVILDISRSGCLLEGPTAIPPGTLVVVRTEVEGLEYTDAVRITRSQVVKGAGDRYRIGAEFAWLWAPEERSMRRLASRITSGGQLSVRPVQSS
jgi:hypothetical protein